MTSTTYTVLVLVRDPWDFKCLIDSSSLKIIITGLFDKWDYFESLDGLVLRNEPSAFVTLNWFTGSSIHSVLSVISSFYWLKL